MNYLIELVTSINFWIGIFGMAFYDLVEYLFKKYRAKGNGVDSK